MTPETITVLDVLGVAAGVAVFALVALFFASIALGGADDFDKFGPNMPTRRGPHD